MLKKKYNPYFFAWFLGSAIFCAVLNLVMESIAVDPDYDRVVGMDLLIVTELSYFTVWTIVATTVWAFLNLLYLKNPIVKACSKQAFTMITTFNILLIVVWAGSFALHPSIIISFTSWWQIFVSVTEHIISPIVLILFYFLSKTDRIKTKDYFLKHSWWTMLLPAVYLVYVISRSAFLHSQPSESDTIVNKFPYPELDPFVNPIYLSVILIIAIFTACVTISTLVNYFSNLALDRFALKENKQTSQTLSVEYNQHKQEVIKETSPLEGSN